MPFPFRFRRASLANIIAPVLFAPAAVSAQILFEDVRVDFPLPATAQNIAAADFNGDARLDVAVASPANSRVYVLLGRGDGTFLPPLVNTVVNQPYSIAVADIDGDGDRDLLIGQTGSSTVQTLLNDGTGAMIAGGNTALDFAPFALAAFDVDGANGPDFIANDSAGLRVYNNNGNGTFTAGSTIPVSNLVLRLQAAKLNGDNRPDLLAAAIGNKTVRALSDGAGGFLAPLEDIYTTDTDGECGIDVDADGDDDVVLCDGSGDSVRVLQNDGTGSLTQIQSLTGMDNPNAPVAADLDGDGDLDLIVPGVNGHELGVYLNTAGVFSTTPTKTRLPGGPVAAVTMNLNGDGAADLAIATTAGVSAFLGDGAGFFRSAPTFATNAQASDVAFADLNGDGANELLTVAQAGGGQLRVRLNDGAGGFGPPSSYTGSHDFNRFAVRDLDTDGDIDIAIVQSNGVVRIFKNDGTGALAAPTLITAGTSGSDIASGDLDGDGDVDLAVTIPVAGQVRVLLNDGTGSFTPMAAIARSGQPTGIRIANLDGDGDLDLAVTLVANDQVSIYKNNGSASFTESTVATGDQPMFLDVADVDGDNAPDLIVPLSGTAFTRVHKNDGTGAFPTFVALNSGTGPWCARAGDLDGDGDLDIAVAGRFSNSIWVHTNFAPMVFLNYANYEARWGPAALAIGDGDANGSPDIAAANFNSNEATLLRNALPTVSSVEVTGPREITVTFSEPIQNGDILAASYTLEGSAKGTLATNPANVAAPVPKVRVLSWSTGEMFIGGDATVTVSPALQDLTAKPLSFGLTRTDVGGGLGTNPGGSFSTDFGSATNDLSFKVDLAMNEQMSFAFGAGNVQVTNGSITDSIGAGGTFEFTVQAAAEGEVDFLIPAGTAFDPAGNPTLEDIKFTVRYDATAPAPMLSTADFTRVGPAPMAIAYELGETGSGIADAQLWARKKGDSYAVVGPLSSLAGNANFAPSQEGVYELAVTAVDNAGNAIATPGAPLLTVIYNADGGDFTHTAMGAGTHAFPMTNELDVLIDIGGAPTIPPTITVNRIVGDGAPAGLNAVQLIDEHIAITGALNGGNAVVHWAYDSANTASLVGPMSTVYQVQGGTVVDQFPATVTPTHIIFGPVLTFSEWWLGNNETRVEDWLSND